MSAERPECDERGMIDPYDGGEDGIRSHPCPGCRRCWRGEGFGTCSRCDDGRRPCPEPRGPACPDPKDHPANQGGSEADVLSRKPGTGVQPASPTPVEQPGTEGIPGWRLTGAIREPRKGEAYLWRSHGGNWHVCEAPHDLDYSAPIIRPAEQGEDGEGRPTTDESLRHSAPALDLSTAEWTALFWSLNGGIRNQEDDRRAWPEPATGNLEVLQSLKAKLQVIRAFEIGGPNTAESETER